MPSAIPPLRHRRWIRRILTLSVAAVLLGAIELSAHDFWIVPTSFGVASGETIELHGQTSTAFPTSLSAVTPDRVAEARILGATSEERITELSVRERSLVLRHRPSTAGQRVVAVALASREARTTPERLKRYLALEGAPELAERYDREGAYPKSDSVTQSSAKFAKTVLEVGANGPRAFSRTVGHALELVAVNDPATLRAGDTLVVRLLYRGRALPHAHLHAGAAPRDSTETAAHRDLSIRTGDDGSARVPLSREGLWNVRSLHGAPAPGGAADRWEVLFATLVFGVQSGGAQRR